MKRKTNETGRIKLPGDKTANDKAKEGAAVCFANGNKPARPGYHPSGTRKMLRDAAFESNVYLDILDAALNVVESELRQLLPAFSPQEITEAFQQHVKTHLRDELQNIRTHGHRNDDPDNVLEDFND